MATTSIPLHVHLCCSPKFDQVPQRSSKRKSLASDGSGIAIDIFGTCAVLWYAPPRADERRSSEIEPG